MITVDWIDDPNFNIPKPTIEIHQSAEFSNTTFNDRTSSTSTFSKDPFQEQFHTSTTLKTPIDQKLEALTARKSLLLKKRADIYNSLSFRFLRLGYNSIKSIDKELKQTEKELISLIRPAFQNRVSKTNEILRQTDSNILKYQSAIQSAENGSPTT